MIPNPSASTDIVKNDNQQQCPVVLAPDVTQDPLVETLAVRDAPQPLDKKKPVDNLKTADETQVQKKVSLLMFCIINFGLEKSKRRSKKSVQRSSGRKNGSEKRKRHGTVTQETQGSHRTARTTERTQETIDQKSADVTQNDEPIL